MLIERGTGYDGRSSNGPRHRPEVGPVRRGPRPTPRPRRVVDPKPVDAWSASLGARCEPIVHLGSGAVVANEVLAARPIAVGTDLAPLGEVLARREREGRIGPVTDRMLARAAGLVRGLEGRVHVNVSATDLGSPDLPQRVARHWQGDACRRLVLELTEHVRLEDGAALRSNLGWLRGQGIGLAVDDYGDGCADDRTIALVLPDVVKVSAVGFGLPGGWSDQVTSIFARIAQHLDGFGVTTVVEGIEDLDQERSAKDCGFDLAQGRRYGRVAGASGVRSATSPHRKAVDPTS